MGLTAFFALSVNAQSSLKVKRANLAELVNPSAKVASPMQVAGGVVCNTQYVAGTTMDLEFTLNLTNTDSEYGDYISVTFPAGFTVNSSPNNPFASDAADPGPDGPEALNPISGQTISWGNNDDNWGGIVAPASYNFTVNVTIGAGVTGTQPTTYSVSGDGYATPTGVDISGTANIYPQGTTIVNLQTKVVGVLTSASTVADLHNCALGTHTIAAQINNLGNASESNIPVNYKINGVTSTQIIFPGTILPGDSTVVIFPITYNFSANNVYAIKAWVAQTGDIALSNDTAALTISNSNPVALTSAIYTNGFETAYEQGSPNLDWLGLGLPFGLSATAHTGTRALFYTVPTTAPTGTYAAMINLPCTDVVMGETYRISYWRKTLSSPAANGMSGIFTGLGQDAASMTTVLKAYSTITPTTTAGPWSKDSVDYVATATETRYFGIGGKGTVSSTSQINVRIDDIKIAKVSVATGIKNNSLTEIAIFPNPTSGMLNINATEVNSSVEVFSVIGEKVYSGNLLKGNNSLDLSGLANGTYIVKMNSDNQTINKKVVISK